MDFIEELSALGINVESALSRLKNNKQLYIEFLREFINDSDWIGLSCSLEELNSQEAFDYAHGLKGMAANLGLEKITELLSELVEILRLGKVEGCEKIFHVLEKKCEELKLYLQ